MASSSAKHPRQTAEWQRAKAKVLKRDQYRCQQCGMAESVWSGADLQVHHIHPVKHGGGNSLENLIVVCNSCHWKLHRKNPEDNRYPLSLLSEKPPRAPSVDPRNNAYLTDMQKEVIGLLKQFGPMRLKDIIDRTEMTRGYIQTVMQRLGSMGFTGRISRGVYVFITEDEYYRGREVRERRAENENDDPILLDGYIPWGNIDYWCYQDLEDIQEHQEEQL